MSETRKLKRDGKVAVIYSPGFGAGWSTWASEHAEAVLFSPELAEALERRSKMERGSDEYNGATRDLCALSEKLFPGVYVGGLAKAKIAWLPEGAAFRVDEYDGSETIRESGDETWMVA